jgi:predicted metal-dependent HD superfamily phosphohydrolase
LDEEFVEMIQLAALFHDTGFIKQYDQNEPIGAEIAEKWLKAQNYPEDKIDIVKRIILATIPTQKPETLPCQIIKDADLDNLSSNDMFECATNLVKELKAVKNLNVGIADLL